MTEMILRSLVGKTGAEARSTIDSLSVSTGMSVGHIYKITAPYRPADRKRRRDAGARKIAVTEEQLDSIQALTVRHDLPAERTIEIAAMNGFASNLEDLKAATYNRILRKRSVTRRRMRGDPEPATLWEGKYPNAIHHFDATKLEHLHYDDDTKLITFDPRKNYKNSRGEKAAPVWLYLVVDDFSRAEFAALYLDLNHYNHLDFIYRAWAEKQRPSEFPFYGIPRHIYMDKGGGNQSLKFLSALAGLGIHVIPTEPSTSSPHGARKHGKVESAFKFWNRWEREFQMSRPLAWEEAEAFLYERMLWRNRRLHSQTKEIPFQRWLKIDRPHHVPNAEFYRTLCYDRWTRAVDNFLTVSLDNEIYKLPETRPAVNWVGEKVQIYAERGRRDFVICVRDGQEVVAKKITRDNLVRPAFSYPQGGEPTSIAEARAKATGTYGPLKLWDSDDKAPAYIPRKGEGFDNAKIKLTGPESQPESLERPAPPQREVSRWLTRNGAIGVLIELGFFAPGRRSDAEIVWVDGLMAGRAQIEEDEIRATVRRSREDISRGDLQND